MLPTMMGDPVGVDPPDAVVALDPADVAEVPELAAVVEDDEDDLLDPHPAMTSATSKTPVVERANVDLNTFPPSPW
jgi:hypothetical protein